MKNKILILIMIIFFIGIINAEGIGTICIDVDPPSMLNSELTIEQKGPSIYLNWTPAEDIPSCSGIDYYDIYRGFNEGNLSFVGSSKDNNYIDKIFRTGNYEYMIHVWDLAGHNEGNTSVSVSEVLIYYSSGLNFSSTKSSRGGSSAVQTYWECGKWGECINGIQSRNCEDIDGRKPDKTELRECSIENKIDNLNYEGNGIKLEDKKETGDYKNILTGAVAGINNFAKSGQGVATFSVLSLIILSLIIIRKIRK
jgi:hypothetical protein